MPKSLPDPALIRKILRYNPDTGFFFWRPRPDEMFATISAARIWAARFADKQAFTANSKGYKQSHILGNKFLAHRVAWCIHYGEWPAQQIDHINGNRSDNRICNLREASYTEQRQNSAKPRTNTSGHIGVYWHKPSCRWRAAIMVESKQISLGYFHCITGAIVARKRADAKYGFHINHGRDLSEG